MSKWDVLLCINKSGRITAYRREFKTKEEAEDDVVREMFYDSSLKLVDIKEYHDPQDGQVLICIQENKNE